MTSSQIARAPDSGDVFDALMTLWGRAYGPRTHDDEPKRASHPIASAMEFGMTRDQYIASKIVGRDGKARRTTMARDLGSCGVRVVPMAYCDPVRATDDSGRHRGLALDPLETPEVQWLQKAWLELHAMFPRQAQAVQLQFQRPDLSTREARAAVLGISAKQWDHELDRGVRWMRCADAMRRVVDRAGVDFPGNQG